MHAEQGRSKSLAVEAEAELDAARAEAAALRGEIERVQARTSAAEALQRHAQEELRDLHAKVVNLEAAAWQAHDEKQQLRSKQRDVSEAGVNALRMEVLRLESRCADAEARSADLESQIGKGSAEEAKARAADAETRFSAAVASATAPAHAKVQELTTALKDCDARLKAAEQGAKHREAQGNQAAQADPALTELRERCERAEAEPGAARTMRACGRGGQG